MQVDVRPMGEADLTEADRIMRLAFGTFVGLPDPMTFMGDADYVRTRWAAEGTVALAAEVDGRLVASNFVTPWGSVGFFGPLTVDPAWWGTGVVHHLLGRTMEVFESWAVRHRGLFTFGHSPKHVMLYQRYGFVPRFLTPILSKPVTTDEGGWVPLSEVADPAEAVAACAALTAGIYDGLDVSGEIGAVQRQKLGDTVLVEDGREPAAFAVCHVGPGTEAGSGACYVKFGAARPGPEAPARFDRLLSACEGFALRRGASEVVAGVNTARRGAYRSMLGRGFRPGLIGVTMHAPDEAAYHHPGAYVIDDWR